MADKPNITLSPSDIVGATTRGLQEILAHLTGNHIPNVHGPLVVQELQRLTALMSHLPAPNVEDKKAA